MRSRPNEKRVTFRVLVACGALLSGFSGSTLAGAAAFMATAPDITPDRTSGIGG